MILLFIFIVIFIIIIYFSIGHREYFDNTPTSIPQTDSVTITPTIPPLDNILIASNAERDQANQVDSALFNLAIPDVTYTTAPPDSIDCEYKWGEWTNCNVLSGLSTREIITSPPLYGGQQCTPPPIDNIQKSCLDTIQYKQNLQGWNVTYNPANLINMGNVSVNIGSEATNTYGMIKSPKMKKFGNANPPNVTTNPSTTSFPPTVSKKIEGFEVTTTPRSTIASNVLNTPNTLTYGDTPMPYIVVGFNNTNGDFLSIPNPKVSLNTTLKLDKGYYVLYYYIQNYISGNFSCIF